MSDLIRILSVFNILKWYGFIIFFSIMLSYFDSSLFINLFQIKDAKINLKTSIFAESIVRIISSILIPVQKLRFITIIFCVLILKICYKEKIEKCILSEALSIIIILALELVFIKISSRYENNIMISDIFIDKFYFINTTAEWIIITLISKVLVYLVIKAKNVHVSIDNTRKNKIEIIIVSIVICIIATIRGLNTSQYSSYTMFVIEELILVTLFYVCFKKIIEINTLENQNVKICNLKSYSTMITCSNDDIRGFKHDFLNFVQALDGYSKVNDMNGIIKMNESVLNDCATINTMKVLNPENFKDPGLYNLLNNKFNLAQQENIVMNVESLSTIDSKDSKCISSFKLCRILAILLDNAIDASKICDKKIINMRFIKEDRENKRIIIIIENTYKEKNIDIEKIFEKGYSTKENSAEHGLGLWNIKKIIEESNNINLLTKKGEMFLQQLEIYN